MRSQFFLANVAALLLIANTGIAQQTDDAIAPFVDDQTLVITRIELAHVDPNATLDWLIDRVKQQGLDQASCDMLRRWWKPSFDKWGGLLTGARDAGVKRAYWLLTLPDLLDLSRPTGLWVFPAQGSVNAQTLLGLIRARQLDARQVRDLVIGPSAGRSVTSDGDATLPPVWVHALASGADVAIHTAVVPTRALRQSFEENVPTLPLTGGPAPITTLTGGIQWIGVSVDLPPKPTVSMVVQCPDERLAQAMGQLVARAIPDIRSHNEQLMRVVPAPAVLTDVLKPTVAGNQVRWEPDVLKTVMPIVVRNTVNAVRGHAGQNLRQLLLGMVMYANNHKGEAPADLNAIVQDQEISPQVLKDPLNPTQKVGFVYIRPMGDWQKDDAELAVMYESAPEGHNVGFADGHVEWFETRKEVEDQVKAAEARNRAAVQGKAK